MLIYCVKSVISKKIPSFQYIFFGRVRKMKRITALVLTLLLSLVFSVVSFADNIYIVEDEEDIFVPDVQTTVPETTTVSETTTSSSLGSSIGSLIDSNGTASDYFNGITDALDSGLDKLLSGLGDGFNQLLPGDMSALEGLVNSQGTVTTNPVPTTSLPAMNENDKPAQSQQSAEKTTAAAEKQTEGVSEEATTAAPVKEVEIHSVLIVNNEKDSSDLLSGSSLTILVFIGGIVFLILAVVIILVLLTRRTEYTSSVKDGSTIPSVGKPDAMTQFLNDDIPNDGNDYSDIAYWNTIE